MSYVIETYMICTLGKGNIDDGGNTIVTSLPIANGCTREQSKVLGFEGVSVSTVVYNVICHNIPPVGFITCHFFSES